MGLTLAGFARGDQIAIGKDSVTGAMHGIRF
jgi:hypothetical protein